MKQILFNLALLGGLAFLFLEDSAFMSDRYDYPPLKAESHATNAFRGPTAPSAPVPPTAPTPPTVPLVADPVPDPQDGPDTSEEDSDDEGQAPSSEPASEENDDKDQQSRADRLYRLAHEMEDMAVR